MRSISYDLEVFHIHGARKVKGFASLSKHIVFKFISNLELSRYTLSTEAIQQVLTVANMAGSFKRLVPLFDRVLVERFVAEVKTKGGIMIPEKAQSKVLNATVVAVGPGSRNQSGDIVPVSVKPGDVVLLPEYGGTKINVDEKEYHLFRDGDILGKWEQ